MSRAPAIELAPGVWRVPTAPRDLVNTFVFVEDDGQVTLVDAGTKRAPKKVMAGLAHIGVAPDDVTRLLVTHAHPDHVGGLSGLRGRTGATVAVHERDAAYVREGKGPVLDRSTLGGRLMRHKGKSAPTPVDDELVDGQVLDVAGGVRVLHTPGHTPGHIALLHEPSRVLITGDSIWNAFNRMRWPSAGCVPTPGSTAVPHRCLPTPTTTSPPSPTARRSATGPARRCAAGWPSAR